MYVVFSYQKYESFHKFQLYSVQYLNFRDKVN